MACTACLIFAPINPQSCVLTALTNCIGNEGITEQIMITSIWMVIELYGKFCMFTGGVSNQPETTVMQFVYK